MADINVVDLALTSLAEFNDGDTILMVHAGKAQQFTVANLKSWVQSNAQGERGPAGPAGPVGPAGTSVTHTWNGTTLTITSASGTSSSNLKGVDGVNGVNGSNGTNGTNGTNGWSPVFSAVDRGDERVFQVYSWVGGTGTMPATGQYVGSTGLVSNITNAVNFRGPIGITGSKGDKGDTGASGVQGLNGWSPLIRLQLVEETGKTYFYLYDWMGGQGIKPNVFGYLSSVGVTPTPQAGSEVTKDFTGDINTINTKLDALETQVDDIDSRVDSGFGKYKDTQYTGSTFFYVAADTTVTLPNNKGTVVESKLPKGVTTLYDGSLIQLDDPDGLYDVQISLKMASSSTADHITLSLVDSASAVVFEQDVKTRGDSYPDAICVHATIAGSASLEAGLTTKIRTYASAHDVFDISYIITKIV